MTKREHPCAVADDPPRNGLAGLKHWRQDVLAGLVVALVSVPLSLGIALASGAPPICGITSEIIAGLIFPFLGGAYVTISGPAAGLAPVLYSSILTLGKGDMHTGYRLVLGVILMAGVVQLILTYLKAARFSYLFPRAAIQGMLAAIGLLIIGKQLPHFVGHTYQSHEFFGLLYETPSQLLHLNPAVFLVSCVCLALLFVVPRISRGWLRFVPAQLLVVVVGIALGKLFHVDGQFLVHVPANPLHHGLVMPDFQGLFSDPKLLGTIVLSVFALTFVDGTESLATIHAVDQIDPFRRTSSPNRTLLAMGVSNICSSLVGGLTIIPGIIKSTTCIMSGGRTAWVNFYNAVFLAIFLLTANDLINLIPIGALSAVLVHIGYKLAGPHKWAGMLEHGRESLLVFTTTVLVTVCSDLLAGIACGIVMEMVVLVCYSLRSARVGAYSPAGAGNPLYRSLVGLFRNPIGGETSIGDACHLDVTGPLTCFNSLALRSAIERASQNSRKIYLHLTPSAWLVDHTSASYLTNLARDCRHRGLELVEVRGLEAYRPSSQSDSSLHYRHHSMELSA